MAGKGNRIVDGMLWDDDIYGILKKDYLYHILCDNLRCKIASANRILVLLVGCGIEKHRLSLNQFTTISLFQNFFVK